MLDKTKQLDDAKLDKITGGTGKKISRANLEKYVNKVIAICVPSGYGDAVHYVDLLEWNSSTRIAKIRTRDVDAKNNFNWISNNDPSKIVQKAGTGDGTLFLVDYNFGKEVYFYEEY